MRKKTSVATAKSRKQRKSGEPGMFKVGRSSCGLGLFAVAPIPKKKYIIEYFGPRLTNAQVDAIDTKYLFELNSRWTIDGAGRANVARYINHSCRPNGVVNITRGKIKIYAKKPISPGDEITYDYGAGYFEKFLEPIGCRCEACLEGKGRTGRRRAAAALKKKNAAAKRKRAS